MQMDSAARLMPAPLSQAQTSQEKPAGEDVFQQIGSLTRLLHDRVTEVGVMPRLQLATDGLPGARSRLAYIAEKTAQAATQVLDSVDRAKADHAAIRTAAQAFAAAVVADPVQAVASGAVDNFVREIEARSAQIDSHLGDIMLAQDFHDLTGQVVAKVVTLAHELEDSLLKLLVQVAPPEHREKVDISTLNGPVVSPTRRGDAVNNQAEVDELLASLGF